MNIMFPTVVIDTIPQDFRCYGISKLGSTVVDGQPVTAQNARVEYILVEMGYSEDEYRAVSWFYNIAKINIESINKLFGSNVASLIYPFATNTTLAGVCQNLNKNPLTAPLVLAIFLERYLEAKQTENTKLLKEIRSVWPDVRDAVKPHLLDTARGSYFLAHSDNLLGDGA